MAEFDSNFQQIMDRVTKSSAEVAEGMTTGARTFIKFAEEPSDRFDTALADEFDTSAMDQQYPSLRQGDGLWGEMGAMQIQHSVISFIRRDCQMRRRTRIRAMAHAAVRIGADASDTGPFNGGVVEYVKAMLEGAGGV